eukprot:CAMPEP_0203827440 /NCGR_PEP_ID=MMETSP0115-20131106/58966_1 /ASSEMBLY_ACC=CAM_ASM_000227 /TAXON_ID=33651 /ORGANISM="Bicosoecid sp, Strain ms1" /LENGTH=1345 /DNA_ID=CAMNT_0050736499 /DNA_START=194 /DNA_END=4231 /DNA_ORIENTATION=+
MIYAISRRGGAGIAMLTAVVAGLLVSPLAPAAAADCGAATIDAVASAALLRDMGVDGEYDLAVQLNDVYALAWAVDFDDADAAAADVAAADTPEGTLRLAMRLLSDADDPQWAGFGIGTTMVDADLTVVWLDTDEPSGATAADDWVVSFDPAFDTAKEPPGADDVVPGSAAGETEAVDGSTTTLLRVARPLRAADADYDLDVRPGAIDIIFAWGDTNPPSYHGASLLRRGTRRLNMYGACSAGDDSGDGGGQRAVDGAGDALLLSVIGLRSEFAHHTRMTDVYELWWTADVADDAAAEADLAAGRTPEGTLRLGIVLTSDSEVPLWGGFGVGRSMVDADLTVVWFDAAAPTRGAAADDWVESFNPKFDTAFEGGEDSIVPGSVSGESVTVGGSTVTVLRVSRPLRAADAFDLAIPPTAATFIFAWGTTSPPSYHGTGRRGRHTIDVFSGEASCEAGDGNLRHAIKSLHGAVMFIAWGVCGPIGIIIARYGKHNNWWLAAHEILMKTAVSGIVPLAAVAIAGRGEHFERPHAVIGVIASSFSFLQLLLGLSAARSMGAAKARSWMWNARRLHKLLGRLLLVAGMTNCFLGLEWLFGPDEATPLQMALAVYAGALLVVITALEAYRQWPAQAYAVEQVVARVLCPCRSGKVRGDGGDDAHGLPQFTWQTINDRVAHGAGWVVVAGMVLDVGQWARSHPGGVMVLRQAFGTDVTADILGVDTDSNGIDTSSSRRLESANGDQRSTLVSPLGADRSASGESTDGGPTSPERALSPVSETGKALADGPAAGGRATPARGCCCRRKGKGYAVDGTAAASSLSPRRSVRRRLHKHSASAWLKFSELVVGTVVDVNVDAGGDSVGSMRLDDATRSLRAATMARATTMRRGVAAASRRLLRDGSRATLADAAATALAVETTFRRASGRGDKITGGRLFRLTLVARRCLTGPRATHPVYRFEFAPPAGAIIEPPAPGQHYWLVLVDDRTHELVERRYTPMVDARAVAALAGGVSHGGLVAGLTTAGIGAAGRGAGGDAPAPARDGTVAGWEGDALDASDPRRVDGLTPIGDSVVDVLSASDPEGALDEYVSRPDGAGAAGDTSNGNGGAAGRAGDGAADAAGADGKRVTLRIDVGNGKESGGDASGGRQTWDNHIVFCIKLYSDGVLSRLLTKLHEGDSVRMRGPMGSRLHSRSSADGRWTHLGIVAGGSGLTPALQLIWFQLAARGASARTMRVSLLFLNKNEDDVFLGDELRDAAAASRGALRVSFGLSAPRRPDEWTGYQGRVTKQMLSETMPAVPGSDVAAVDAFGDDDGPPAPTNDNTRIIVCGPGGMVASTVRQLRSLGFDKKVIVALE